MARVRKKIKRAKRVLKPASAKKISRSEAAPKARPPAFSGPVIYPSPWKTAWFSPVLTINNVIKNKKLKAGLFPIAFCFGFNEILSRANIWHSGDRYPLIAILGVALIAALPVGLIGLAIRTGILKWTGERFGGVGTGDEVGVAVLWATVPSLLMTLIHLLQVVLMGDSSFKTVSHETMGLMDAFSLMLTGFGALATSFWVFILLVLGLAEINKFSKWKAAATILVWFIPTSIIFYLMHK